MLAAGCTKHAGWRTSIFTSSHGATRRTDKRFLLGICSICVSQAFARPLSWILCICTTQNPQFICIFMRLCAVFCTYCTYCMCLYLNGSQWLSLVHVFFAWLGKLLASTLRWLCAVFAWLPMVLRTPKQYCHKTAPTRARHVLRPEDMPCAYSPPTFRMAL